MRILRMPEVLERVGLSRSTVWRLAQADQFPKPVKLGGRAVGWIEEEIDAWIASRSRAG